MKCVEHLHTDDCSTSTMIPRTDLHWLKGLTHIYSPKQSIEKCTWPKSRDGRCIWHHRFWLPLFNKQGKSAYNWINLFPVCGRWWVWTVTPPISSPKVRRSKRAISMFGSVKFHSLLGMLFCNVASVPEIPKISRSDLVKSRANACSEFPAFLWSWVNLRNKRLLIQKEVAHGSLTMPSTWFMFDKKPSTTCGSY